MLDSGYTSYKLNALKGMPQSKCMSVYCNLRYISSDVADVMSKADKTIFSYSYDDGELSSERFDFFSIKCGKL